MSRLLISLTRGPVFRRREARIQSHSCIFPQRMPRQFKNNDIEFLFPENWELAESYQETEGVEFQVTLESPTGAMWLLTACRGLTQAASLIDELKQEVTRQFDSIEWLEVSDQLLGQDFSGLDGNFFSLDLLVAAQVRLLNVGTRILVILSQAESRDFERLQPVFRAIATSLLQSQSTAGQRDTEKLGG